MATATMTRGQLDLFAPTLKAKPPIERAKDACMWARDNRTSFTRFVNALLELSKREPYISRDNAYYIAKHHSIEISLIGELKRDHNLWAALSRYAIMLHPELINHIKPKPANIDTVDLAYVWRSIVDRETVFEVGSWMQAAKWCEVHA